MQAARGVRLQISCFSMNAADVVYYTCSGIEITGALWHA